MQRTEFRHGGINCLWFRYSISHDSNNSTALFAFQVGIEGITYAGNHGLEILHPDGSRFVHPMPMELQDKVVELLKSLQEQVSYQHG